MAYYGSPAAGDRRARMVVVSVIALGTVFIAVMLVMANSLGKLAETKGPTKEGARGTATASAAGVRSDAGTTRGPADGGQVAATEPGTADRAGGTGGESVGPSVDQALAAADERMGQARPGGITMDPSGNRVSPVSQDQLVDQGYVGSGLPDSAPRGVASDEPTPSDLPEGYEGRGRSSPDVVTSPGD